MDPGELEGRFPYLLVYSIYKLHPVGTQHPVRLNRGIIFGNSQTECPALEQTIAPKLGATNTLMLNNIQISLVSPE